MNSEQATGITIAGRNISSSHPCFVIAEAGVNHNGNEQLAFQLIDVAVKAQVDAVKFQTFKAERLVTLDAPKAAYQNKAIGQNITQFDMLRQLELSTDLHQRLIDYCQKKGILFLSTPFDEESADLLMSLNIPAFKVPSGEVTNLPFLQHIARLNKPVIMSTGMCWLGEVAEAVQTIHATGNNQLALLHCVSNYPADPVDVNLRAIQTLSQSFHLPTGYSDHTQGTDIALAAVARGACILEKHFTLDRSLPGPDHAASLEPRELEAMVKSIRRIEAAFGHGRKEPALSEGDTSNVARRSIVAAVDLPAGSVLEDAHLVNRRPGHGIPPKMRSFLLGRRTRDDLRAGDMILLEKLV